MPLTNTLPHSCTDVVLLSGPGRESSFGAEAGQVGVGVLHQRGVDPGHVRASHRVAVVGDLEAQRVGDVFDPRLRRVIGRHYRGGAKAASDDTPST